MSSVLAIIDFEATCCDQGSVPRDEMEIIEIGCVAVDSATGRILSEFGCFVRPVRHPFLTGFCTRLTTITQADVDAAVPFPEALTTFARWLENYEEPVFCSWGDYDRKQLEQDCTFHRVAFPFSGRHRNLKAEFSASISSSHRFGLGQALRHLRLDFEGTPHRGIDDARNIARVYAEAILPCDPK